MPVLSKPKDEKLAQNLAKGTMTDQAACRSAGFTTDPSAVSRKTKQPHIQERVREIRALRDRVIQRNLEAEIETSHTVAGKLGITRAKILESLWENARNCLRGAPILGEDGKPTGEYRSSPSNPAAANQALKLLGLECHNMFVEKMELGNPGDFARLTDDELFNRIEEDAAALGLSSDATTALLAMFSGDGVKH
jgi:hypothetical protein